MAAPDVLLNAVAVEMLLEKLAKGAGIEQAMRVTTAEHAAEGKVHNPGERVVSLGENIAAKDVWRLEAGPDSGNDLGGETEIIAAGGERRAVDGSGGRSPDDGERIPLRLHAFDFANAIQNTGLIRSAGASARHD